MKKIYSLFMALSFVLCAMANSPFVMEKQLDLSKAKQLAPVEKSAKVARLNKQDARQAMVEARQSKAVAPMAIKGVRQIEAVQKAAKQVIPTNVATKAPAKAAAEATDTVKFVAAKWSYLYYAESGDWWMAVIDPTGTYRLDFDYIVPEENFAGTYTTEDLDLGYSYLTIEDNDGYVQYVKYVEASLTVTASEAGKFMTANVLCENGTRFLVSAEELLLPEPKATVELAYANATLEDGTRSSETFQFWADENGVYTSFLIASDEVVGEYTQDDMYVAYANYIMFVDGTDTTFVDFLGFDMAITKEDKTYNLVADVLGSDTIMYHITMSYTKPAPTDTIDIVATNLYIDEFEFYGMVFTTATASNDEYEVTFDLNIALEEGEYATEDFNASYCGIVRTSDMEEIAMTEISATVTGEGGDRVIKAEVVGSDNVLYNMDLSYVVPEATDTVNVVFDELAEVEYYASYGDYYLFNQNENYILTLDIFEEKGNLMGEYAAEDFDMYYTRLGVIADGDTTVVTIADAKAVVTATAEEGIVLIEAELTGMDAVLYKVSTKADMSDKGLQYDATEGFLMDEYTTEDIYTINDQSANGYIMFDVESADGNDMMGLVFWVDGADEKTIIPTGTYQINGTTESGTVLASTGMGSTGLTYSLYATLDEEGYIVEPCWFMVGGEVVVSEKDGILSIYVDAVNSNNLPIFITCEYNLNTKQGLPYDATEGAVDRTYTAEDNVVINTKTGYFQVQATAANGSDMVSMAIFGQADEETIIPVGTYEINDTQAAGTVLASVGVVGQNIYPSFYGKLSANGGIVPPCYFFVDGTVEVSAADGKLTIEVNAVNSYDVPVHAVIEYALDTKQGLQYDEQTGSVNRTYTTEDILDINTDYIAQYNLLVDIVAADYSDQVSLLFFVPAADPEIGIPAGTYPIASTPAMNTILAAEGVNAQGQVAPSFYSTLVEQGGQLYLDKLYFFVSGQAVVEKINGKLKMTIDALNSYDVPVHIVYDATNVETAIENVTVNNNASKVVEDNQLFIIKDGVKYNVMGSVVK